LKKSNKIIILITILIVLVVISTYLIIIKTNENDYQEYFNFNVIFTPESIENNEINYIIVPIPLHKNSTNEMVIEKLNALNISYKLENTTYGKGLNLSLREKIDISIEGKSTIEMMNDKISLLDSQETFDEGNFWIYSTNAGTMKYKYEVRWRDSELTYYFNEQIQDGWQVVEINIWDEVIN
jgi:hypothetical protein